MALAVMVSTFGCANGLVLAGARVAWAMARDGLFLAPAARLNDRHVPGPALWMQGAWASVLALSGRYSDLLDYVIVAELLFYLLTVGGPDGAGGLGWGDRKGAARAAREDWTGPQMS